MERASLGVAYEFGQLTSHNHRIKGHTIVIILLVFFEKWKRLFFLESMNWGTVQIQAFQASYINVSEALHCDTRICCQTWEQCFPKFWLSTQVRTYRQKLPSCLQQLQHCHRSAAMIDSHNISIILQLSVNTFCNIPPPTWPTHSSSRNLGAQALIDMDFFFFFVCSTSLLPRTQAVFVQCKYPTLESNTPHQTENLIHNHIAKVRGPPPHSMNV